MTKLRKMSKLQKIYRKRNKLTLIKSNNTNKNSIIYKI